MHGGRKAIPCRRGSLQISCADRRHQPKPAVPGCQRGRQARFVQPQNSRVAMDKLLHKAQTEGDVDSLREGVEAYDHCVSRGARNPAGEPPLLHRGVFGTFGRAQGGAAQRDVGSELKEPRRSEKRTRLRVHRVIDLLSRRAGTLYALRALCVGSEK
jgi:hypothetical protein